MHHILKKSLMAFAAFGALVGFNSAIQARGEGPCGPGQQGFLEDLTDSQRAELHEQRLELEQEGAAPSAMRDASRTLLEGWGVDLPGMPERRKEGRGPQRFMEELDSETRAELYSLRRELLADGASHREVRQARREKLALLGVDLPEPRERKGRGKGHGVLPGLSESQRDELHSLRRDLRDAGKDREEIRQACDARLKEWGLEPPAKGRRHGKDSARRGPGRMLEETLEREQRAELYKLRESLLAEGAAPSVIHENMRLQLEEWGLEVPEGLEEEQKPQTGSRPSGKARVTPNPFNPTTTLAFALEEGGAVNLTIYDLQGRRVRNIGPLQQTAGEARIRWDGRNDAGTRVASGTYVYTITGPGLRLDGRMSLIQ